ncbi:hypothetical protein ATANTOWER_024039 [Ataeniobius toweri]|uniref:Uncharacterized protein n=1 Tax=Ataeniobius toweri TaxID=208326 RepID=A0ABU7BKT1_9TELE|nr:hypothetical protein [Ataeniobius toweri]
MRFVCPERQRCYPAVCLIHVNLSVHEVKEKFIFHRHAKFVIILCPLKHVSAQAVYLVTTTKCSDTWKAVGSFSLSIFSFTIRLLVHGLRMEWLPLTRTLVLKTLLPFVLCVLPRHTSPMIFHPRLRRWANGALEGP